MSETKHPEASGLSPAAKRTVITIVADHLRANGFGGLVQPDEECGCELDDLQPCGESFASCLPGYKHLTPDNDEHDWIISTDKDWKPEEHTHE